MDKNGIYLYDELNRPYERKNKYILELKKLEDALNRAPQNEKEKFKAQIQALKNNKKNHAYTKAWEAFKKEEKDFLENLKKEIQKNESEIDSALPGKLKKLKVRLFAHEKKMVFYKPYAALSYDVELLYKESKIQSEQLPAIIEEYASNYQEYLKAKDALKNLDQEKQKKSLEKHQKICQEQKKIFNEGVLRLKKKKSEASISEKALKNGIKELKKKKDESVKLSSYQIEKNSIKEHVRHLKYLLNTEVSRKLRIIQSNISDARRTVPVEVERKRAWHAYPTALLPGLGQLLNGQFVKSALFFLSSLYIYLIAVPYALGYGNYQGQGVRGLITLAEGGRRIDSSIIFMIEGIVAIVLLLIAFVLLIISYKDTKKVDRGMVKGVRPKNYFETIESVQNEGFPYLVSIPALVVTLFIVIVPITTAVLLSFTNMNPQNQSKFQWIGLDNYMLLARGEGLAGSVFYSILGWTIVWTLTATTLAILVGFFLALLVNNERVKGKAFFRTVFLLPWAVPAFITIMFFSIMFSTNGMLTEIISNIAGQDIFVKRDPTLSRITLIFLQTWLGSSYVFLLSTGVLQAIPADLYEAAQIDGATAWQKLRRITLPIVLFQTAPLLVGQYTFNFNNFSIIYLFNSGGPFNPVKYGNLAGSTDLLISYIYKLTMENQFQAIGAAITIVISLGLMLFAFIGFRNSKAFREERL